MELQYCLATHNIYDTQKIQTFESYHSVKIWEDFSNKIHRWQELTDYSFHHVKNSQEQNIMATVILNSQSEIPILNVFPAEPARNRSILANLNKKTVGIYHVL